MATPAQWLAGARPRTLPAAVAPVLAGTGVAAYVDERRLVEGAARPRRRAWRSRSAVNYANDYSDGIRGTDDDRVGPMRLVGSGAATPRAVKRAAFLAFGVAARRPGLVLAATTAWWLVAVGAASASLAAWFYTGGSKPYGYLGLGEVMVFVFFGLVAVVGTTYVQTETWEWAALCTPPSASARSPARSSWSTTCATSRPTPWPASARWPWCSATERTRLLYLLLVLAAAAAVVAVAVATTWCALVGLGFLLLAAPGARTGARRGHRPGLIPVLQQTGLAELVWAGLVAAALVVCG